MKQRVVNLKNAKTREYRGVIRKIATEGKCPFCPDNFKYHKNPILMRRDDWFITRSTWPYKNARFHFLIVGTRHKEKFRELHAADWEKIISLANWAITKFHLKGGALALRFGDTAHTGATVCHLHAHLIVPHTQRKGSRQVMFPVG